MGNRNMLGAVESDGFTVVRGNAFEILPGLEECSVDFVVTDPPYFLDGMDGDWDRGVLDEKKSKAGVIGSLPVGMKFDPAQGRRFQKFMAGISGEIFRILKPGGFFVCFSQARLYHRLGVAVEDSGFELRDMLGWVYEGQAKAFSQGHFVRRMLKRGAITEKRAGEMLESLAGRKTPQLKPQIEPMVLAQKPKDGTFVNNWMLHGVGLVDTTASLDGKFPGNLMRVPKPDKKEKGAGNEHLTVKPVKLISHLIRLFTAPGQIVLDPFAGSGSHGVAAGQCGRRFVGIEIEKEYKAIAERRIRAAFSREGGAG